MNRSTQAHRPAVAIVDDDASIRFSLEVLLDTRGFSVTCFESAEALLAGIDQLTAACLIVDVWMPGLSGIELIAKLRDRGIRTPVVMLTGHGDSDAAERAAAAGARCVLPKPCETQELIDELHAAIDDSAASTLAG